MVFHHQPESLGEGAEILPGRIPLLQLQHVVVGMPLQLVQTMLVWIGVIHYLLQQCVLLVCFVVLQHCQLAVHLIAVLPERLVLGVNQRVEVLLGR